MHPGVLLSVILHQVPGVGAIKLPQPEDAHFTILSKSVDILPHLLVEANFGLAIPCFRLRVVKCLKLRFVCILENQSCRVEL